MCATPTGTGSSGSSRAMSTNRVVHRASGRKGVVVRTFTREGRVFFVVSLASKSQSIGSHFLVAEEAEWDVEC